jgi:elongation factor 1-alpha
MSIKFEDLEEKIKNGERETGNVEFKKSLKKSTHLNGKKRSSLVAQMKHRILSGDGMSIYIIGVDDDGSINGISKSRYEETKDVILKLAKDANARVTNIDKYSLDSGNFVGAVEIVDMDNTNSDQIIVGTAGHVDHGKSTLVGSLVTGEKDDGKGKMRSSLDLLPHEVERGLSADLSYSVYGFDTNGSVNTLNSSRGSNKSEVVKNSDKIVSFVDTVGHKPWLHTTIRGLSQQLDYGLLTVSASEGVTETTKEHLGILIAMDIPTVISITKCDLVESNEISQVQDQIKNLLDEVDTNHILASNYTVEEIKNRINGDTTVIINTSAVSRRGLDKLNDLFYKLPNRTNSKRENFKMYIDETYTVEGVGTVISGAIKSGSIEEGDKIFLGPFNDAEYKRTKAKSLEIHYHSVEKAKEGQLVSIALSDVREEEIERGMCVLSESSNKRSIQEFEAEVIVLNHPTSIRDGYEPVVHIESISETSIVRTDNILLPGQKGTVKFEFKFNQHNIEEGQRFIFREGESKGIGTVKNIID